MREINLRKIYRHFKGQLNVAEDLACHSKTQEDFLKKSTHSNKKIFVRDCDSISL